MMLHKKHELVTRVARFAFWFFSISNALAALWGKLPEWTGGPAVWTYIRTKGAEYSGSFVLLCSACVALAALIRKRYGSETTWDTLHELITELRAAVFKGEGYENPDHHKVTIFRAMAYCPRDPWYMRLYFRFSRRHRWLVPIARSHHLSQATTTCFELSDDSAKCCGVAGQAYARDCVVAVDGLPDVSDQPPAKEIKHYAKDGFVTKDWVSEKKPKARSILAMPLLVGGKPWGVVVFDSRIPGKIKYNELADIFEVIQNHISRLIHKHL